MPKRTDIHSILLIGAGPIIIGQACEFDYSGAQACKALREEGYRVVLVNSNPATIMTDPETADAVYIEPINWRTVARIIEKERPDALLPTMGGQTALNTALDLVREGVLEKYGVELIAASRAATADCTSWRTLSAVPTGTVDLVITTLYSLMYRPIVRATASTERRSAEPSSSGGVPTAIS